MELCEFKTSLELHGKMWSGEGGHRNPLPAPAPGDSQFLCLPFLPVDAVFSYLLPLFEYDQPPLSLHLWFPETWNMVGLPTVFSMIYFIQVHGFIFP